MDNNQASQMVSQNESLQNNSETTSPTQILETQPVSTINSENNNTFELKKWLIAGGVVVITLAICIFLSQETEVCFLSTCNDYRDAVATNSSSIGNDFIAYAGGAASLIALTAVGVSLLPAVAISTGVWFVVHLIR